MQISRLKLAFGRVSLGISANIQINALLRDALLPLHREIAWNEPMTRAELNVLSDAATKLTLFVMERLEELNTPTTL